MLDIIYEDEDVIVVRKKSGIPVQTQKVGQKDMVSLLKNYQVSQGQPPYIGVVHRLDQPVEGVMVFARNPKAAATLSQQIAKHQAEKQYLAMVLITEGKHPVIGENCELEDYLLRDGENNCSSVVEKGVADAKKASLSYSFERIKGNIGCVRVTLHTGRHHQIRVQMAHAGYPLIGDRKYATAEALALSGRSHVALCSVTIGFIHPATKKKMEFTIMPENPLFGE